MWQDYSSFIHFFSIQLHLSVHVRRSSQYGLAHSALGALLAVQFPMEDELGVVECPSQNMASLGFGGLGKDRELSSREAWFWGGGGRKTEQGSLPTRASPGHLWVGQGPLYQQSSLRLSGSSVPDDPPGGRQGRPELEGSGGALGGRGTDTRGTARLLFFSTSSRHWTGTVEAAGGHTVGAPSCKT